MDIRVVGISKDFGASPALRDVSLEVKPGELVALLGPSGSGKTTLLRVIAGLEKPAAGQVYFGDIDATRLSVQQRQVGFVFQHYALFKHMTVAENIGYGLRVRERARRPGKREMADRVEGLLDLMQLGGLGGRYPAQLSGGQRQRVALARALAVEPRVLLLDEPFGALDAKVRKDLRRWLRQIHTQTGHTTIFVTHDQDEALELADRVAILNSGRLEQIGTPDDVYTQPASPFVMSFVGDTTLLPVVVRQGRVLLGAHDLAIDPQGAPDGPAELYLRPSDLQLKAPDAAALSAEVVAMRRTVAGRRAELVMAPGDKPIEVEVPERLTLNVGDRIGFDIAHARLFAAS